MDWWFLVMTVDNMGRVCDAVISLLECELNTNINIVSIDICNECGHEFVNKISDNLFYLEDTVGGYVGVVLDIVINGSGVFLSTHFGYNKCCKNMRDKIKTISVNNIENYIKPNDYISRDFNIVGIVDDMVKDILKLCNGRIEND